MAAEKSLKNLICILNDGGPLYPPLKLPNIATPRNTLTKLMRDVESPSMQEKKQSLGRPLDRTPRLTLGLVGFGKV
ncbi:hypothetical protein E1200_26790 [Actinomadura sp. GC306]|uniref:hypothetical protein n=1 Tax=Actinomadura sp. GC306 TaxID=2530367 RepID=UPI00104CFD68|nr:hypothetical protein [Actinomadura sp. GC306]TDC62130.1 hypothetical protein E1200_26790 [Actinomadura sp. GC306]